MAELNALQCASLKYLEVVLGIYQCSVTKLLSLFFCGLGLNLPELAPSFAVDQPELKQNKKVSSTLAINYVENIYMHHCLDTL